jgi:hypothetical protein
MRSGYGRNLGALADVLETCRAPPRTLFQGSAHTPRCGVSGAGGRACPRYGEMVARRSGRVKGATRHYVMPAQPAPLTRPPLWALVPRIEGMPWVSRAAEIRGFRAFGKYGTYDKRSTAAAGRAARPPGQPPRAPRGRGGSRMYHERQKFTESAHPNPPPTAGGFAWPGRDGGHPSDKWNGHAEGVR